MPMKVAGINASYCLGLAAIAGATFFGVRALAGDVQGDLIVPAPPAATACVADGVIPESVR